jgi:hypothetical protein
LVAVTVHGKVVKNIIWKPQSMISDNLIYHRSLKFLLKNGLTVCTLHKFLNEENNFVLSDRLEPSFEETSQAGQ